MSRRIVIVGGGALFYGTVVGAAAAAVSDYDPRSDWVAFAAFAAAALVLYIFTDPETAPGSTAKPPPAPVAAPPVLPAAPFRTPPPQAPVAEYPSGRCVCAKCTAARAAVLSRWSIAARVAPMLLPLAPGGGILLVFLRARGLSRSDAALLSVAAWLASAVLLYVVHRAACVTAAPPR